MIAIASFALVLLGISMLGIPACPSRALFGIPCPGCGLTRATLALARGDVAAAWRFHPLAPFVIALLAQGAYAAILRRLRPTTRVREPSARAYVIVAITLVVLWLVRLGGGLGGLPDPVAPERGLVTSHLLAR